MATRSDGRPSGLAWEVVESLPVSEAIKDPLGGPSPPRGRLAGEPEEHRRPAGIEVVCYNFMPVIDWTRTDLAYEVETGATCMRFDLADFAAFDVFVLEREGAADALGEDLLAEAKRRFEAMGEDERAALARNVTFGLPGAADNFTLEDVRARLADYAAIGPDELRANLVAFLSDVAPLAEELGVRLCCHPDDPPFRSSAFPASCPPRRTTGR